MHDIKDFPTLNGLVLAGGKSRRMGYPKDKIDWHGKEQRYYIADLLAKFCAQVFISCRQDQLEDANPNYHYISDKFLDMGPFGGLLSAFDLHKDKAWLMIACDLPLLDKKSIETLVQSRAPEKTATVYESSSDGLPEPMIAIWEPESYSLLCHSLDKATTSLRKILMTSNIKILKPHDPDILMNVNSPEEFMAAKKILGK